MIKKVLSSLMAVSILMSPCALAGPFDFFLDNNPINQQQSPQYHSIILKYFNVNDYGITDIKESSKLGEIINKCKENILLPSLDPFSCEYILYNLVFEQPDKEVITAARELLTLDEDNSNFLIKRYRRAEMIIWWAIQVLGLARDSQSVSILTNLIDKNSKIYPSIKKEKAFIVNSLWWIGDKSSSKFIADIMENTDYTYEHKSYGAYYLGLWQSKDAIDVCKRALREESRTDVLAACMYYLGMLKETSVIPSLIRLIDKYERDVVIALTLMGDKSAIEPLKQRLNNYTPEQYTYRVPILTALAKCGDKNSFNTLINTYLIGKTANWATREYVANYSVLLKGTQYEGDLKKYLNNILKEIKGTSYEDERNKVIIYSALSQLGDKNALAQIIKALNNSIADVRIIALKTLGGSRNYSYNNYNGFGLVGISDLSIIPKLKEFYDVEREEDQRLMAVYAALEIYARNAALKK